MRAAVVGSNWGAVHVAALREAGVEVVALVGRREQSARAAADRLGVAGALSDVRELGGLDLDLVTIATPPGTHAQVIADLPDLPVICEKPAVGVHRPATLPPGRTAPVWVNYAFGFLDAAEQAAANLADAGSISAVQVTSSFDLAGEFSPHEWFFELVTHPWSWVCALLGSPAPVRAPASPDLGNRLSIHVQCGAVPVAVAVVREPGLSGIAHEVNLVGTAGELRVRGVYRVGRDWAFAAPLLVRAASQVPLGDEVSGPPDPWYQANVRSIAAILATIKGAAPHPMMFSWQSALELDRCAQEALGDG